MTSIDQALHFDIQKVSDFAFLDGRVFRESFIQILENDPDLSGFRQDQYVLKYKKVRADLGNCFNHAKELDNPLRMLIDRQRVSYKRGGIFTLKNIKASFHKTNVYMDITFLVGDAGSDSNYDMLVKY